MKKILTLILALISSIALSIPGEGGSGGGPRMARPYNSIPISEIFSIETSNRNIINNSDIKSNFITKNGYLVNFNGILNIETNSGEILIP
jgi:hypothetical protein